MGLNLLVSDGLVRYGSTRLVVVNGYCALGSALL